jgi:hypothetical protein
MDDLGKSTGEWVGNYKERKSQDAYKEKVAPVLKLETKEPTQFDVTTPKQKAEGSALQKVLELAQAKSAGVEQYQPGEQWKMKLSGIGPAESPEARAQAQTDQAGAQDNMLRWQEKLYGATDPGLQAKHRSFENYKKMGPEQVKQLMSDREKEARAGGGGSGSEAAMENAKRNWLKDAWMITIAGTTKGDYNAYLSAVRNYNSLSENNIPEMGQTEFFQLSKLKPEEQKRRLSAMGFGQPGQ